MVVSLKTGTADILCHWFVTFYDDGLDKWISMVVSLKTGTADILCHWFVSFYDDGLDKWIQW